MYFESVWIDSGFELLWSVFNIAWLWQIWDIGYDYLYTTNIPSVLVNECMHALIIIQVRMHYMHVYMHALSTFAIAIANNNGVNVRAISIDISGSHIS